MEPEEISELGLLLDRLRRMDTRHRIFGSSQHKYQVGPVLAESRLAAFESANDVRLPEDYRLFLASIGDGGAGPYYGLEPLGTFGHNLSRPFPLVQPSDELSAEERAETLDQDALPGVLEFCHHGCGIYSYLIVNGPTYGTIWVGREAFYPTGLTFGAWYRRWLQRAIDALENERLIPLLRVGMTRDEVVARVGGDWKERLGSQGSPRYFEATDFPAQLELNDEDIVTIVRPWPFIAASPW